jgi:hypothetical protein
VRLRWGLLGLAGATALAITTASAATETTVKVPGAFKTETIPSADGTRCSAYLTYTWGHIPGAISYRVQATDTITGSYDDTVEPGFDAGAGVGLPPVGKNRQRTTMNSSHGPAPCPGDINGGRWTVEVTANFDEGSRIVGTVTRSDESPAVGVPISIRGPDSSNPRTNEGGAYGAKLKKAGRYTVKGPDGYCVVGASGCRQSTSFNLKKGGVESVDFRSVGDGRITGTVRLGCGGADSCRDVVVPDAEVTAETAGGTRSSERITATTDGGGRYEMDVPDDARYRVSADASPMQTHPGEQFVDVAPNGEAEADFTVCGYEGGSSPGANRLARGSWRSVACASDEYQATFTGPPRSLLKLTWRSTPICQKPSGEGGAPERLDFSKTRHFHDQSAISGPGAQVTVTEDQVVFNERFKVKALGGARGLIAGTLRQDGGQISGRLEDPPCRYGAPLVVAPG